MTRAWRGRAPVSFGVVAAAISFAASWVPSYWGDEVATVRATSVPVSELIPFLGIKDAVHGTYYLLMHEWVHAFGTSELATRLPSALAVGIAAAGLVVVGRQLAVGRLGPVAAMVFAVLPRTTYMGAEARSYALSAAIAVWLTVVLLWARRRGGVLPYVVYALVTSLALLVFVYLVLLIVAHLVALAILRAPRPRLIAAAVAGLAPAIALIPFLRVVAGEKTQVAWLGAQSPVTLWTVLVEPWFDESIAAAVIGWALIIGGGVLWRRVLGATGGAPLALAGTWVVVPLVGLLVANILFGPLYTARYVSFTAPGFALLIAAALLALPWRRALPIGLTALVIAAMPSYVGQRTPFAKNGGSDLRQLAATIHTHARPGDAVAFDNGAAHPRQALNAYPQDFAGLRDVGWVSSFPASGTFSDRVLDTADLPITDTRTLWFASSTLTDDCASLPEASRFTAAGLVPVKAYPVHRTTVCEFARR